MNTNATKGLRSTAIAVTLAAGCAMGLAPNANAGAKAYAQLTFDEFRFLEQVDDNGTPSDPSDDTYAPLTLSGIGGGGDIQINNLHFLGTAGNAVTRFVGMGAGSDNTNAVDPTILNGITLDAPQACVGVCPAAENNFAMGNFNTDEYNRADQVTSGTGFVRAPVGDDPFSTSLVAEAITQGGAIDQADSNVENGTQFTVTASRDIVLALQTDFLRSLFVELHPGVIGSATAGVNFQIQLEHIDLVNGNTAIGLLTFDGMGGFFPLNAVNTLVDDLVQTTTAGPGGRVDETTAGTLLTITNGVLLAGQSYNVSFTFTANAELQATKPVPEPSPLALMSLGLLGVAFGYRRRRTS